MKKYVFIYNIYINIRLVKIRCPFRAFVPYCWVGGQSENGTSYWHLTNQKIYFNKICFIKKQKNIIDIKYGKSIKSAIG